MKAEDLRLDACERVAIVRALRVCGGNLVLTARALGIARSTLYRKMHEHKLGDDVSVQPPSAEERIPLLESELAQLRSDNEDLRASLPTEADKRALDEVMRAIPLLRRAINSGALAEPLQHEIKALLHAHMAAGGRAA